MGQGEIWYFWHLIGGSGGGRLPEPWFSLLLSHFFLKLVVQLLLTLWNQKALVISIEPNESGHTSVTFSAIQNVLITHNFRHTLFFFNIDVTFTLYIPSHYVHDYSSRKFFLFIGQHATGLTALQCLKAIHFVFSLAPLLHRTFNISRYYHVLCRYIAIAIAVANSNLEITYLAIVLSH